MTGKEVKDAPVTTADLQSAICPREGKKVKIREASSSIARMAVTYRSDLSVARGHEKKNGRLEACPRITAFDVRRREWKGR